MKFITKIVSLIGLYFSGFSMLAQSGAVPGSNCAGMNEMCSDVGSVYASTVGVFAPAATTTIALAPSRDQPGFFWK